MSSNPDYFPPASGPLSILTRPIAMLRHEPPQLEALAGVRFRAAHDDLDLLDWAEVVGLSGRRYALVRHRSAPQNGTEIVTSQDSRNPLSDLRDVLRGLNLTDRDLVWTAPEVFNDEPKQRGSTTAKVRGRKPSPLETAHRGEMRLPLTSAALSKLRKPVRGQGGFQSLLRKLQTQLDGGELQVTVEDVERLVRYSASHGGGGFQERTRSAVKTSKRAAKKR